MRPVSVEGDIAQMVIAVLDAPVVWNGLACLVGVGEMSGQVKAGFTGSFPLSGRGVESQDAPLDADDGGDRAMPVGAGDDDAGVEDW